MQGTNSDSDLEDVAGSDSPGSEWNLFIFKPQIRNSVWKNKVHKYFTTCFGLIPVNVLEEIETRFMFMASIPQRVSQLVPCTIPVGSAETELENQVCHAGPQEVIFINYNSHGNSHWPVARTKNDLEHSCESSNPDTQFHTNKLAWVWIENILSRMPLSMWVEEPTEFCENLFFQHFWSHTSQLVLVQCSSQHVCSKT